MTAVTTPSPTARRDRVPAAPKPPRGLPGVKKIALIGSAYLIALIFITPYIEMFLTALRPVNETADPTIIPTGHDGVDGILRDWFRESAAT